MTYIKSTLLICTLIVFTVSLYAQDKIYKKDQSIITCKIIEIGLDQVKYHTVESPTPIITMDKNHIIKIELEGGTSIAFSDPMKDPNEYADQKKYALKIGFLSPLYSNTNLSLEKSLRPGRSVEGTFGVIGLTTKQLDDRESGIFFKIGYKALRTPDFYLRGMKYAHILKGTYIKPELQFSFFERDEYESEYSNGKYIQHSKREDKIAAAFMLNIGKQIVYDDFILIDYYVGVGYGVDNSNSNTGDFYHAFSLGGNDAPVAVTAGLKVGVLIK